MNHPSELSDDQLLAQLRDVCSERQRLLAQLIVLLVEVEERRLHLQTSCPSVYEFCKQELGMSDGAAFRRSVAARLVKKFPALLEPIERGTIHLSTLCLLRDHLTTESFAELVAACAGKSTRQVEELLARRAPRPDLPARLAIIPTQAALPTASVAESATPSRDLTRTNASARERAYVAPLAEERFAMQLTIGRELRDNIERARDLMRHANVDGDLERVVDRAMDALLEKLEKRRLAKTERAQTKPRAASPTSEHVPAAVRRAVFERDGAQCTYVDARGKRCTSCTLLEVDHVVARADGGANRVENLRVRCRGHNRLSAEERFGKEHVERCIELRRRKWDVDGADLVVRGLVHMGFASREAKRAVETVAQRHEHDEAPLPKEQILRQALRLLSD